MSALDLIIIAAIAVAFVMCIRYLSRHNEDCTDCTHASACSAAARARGHCVAADDMLRRVDAAFDQKPGSGTTAAKR